MAFIRKGNHIPLQSRNFSQKNIVPYNECNIYGNANLKSINPPNSFFSKYQKSHKSRSQRPIKSNSVVSK